VALMSMRPASSTPPCDASSFTSVRSNAAIQSPSYCDWFGVPMLTGTGSALEVGDTSSTSLTTSWSDLTRSF
jgi:hypothetical protein